MSAPTLPGTPPTRVDGTSPSSFALGRTAALAIASITIREGARAKLPLAWAFLALGLWGLQTFVGALALIDGETVVLSIVAPIARLLAVLVTAVFVIAPLSRELADRGTDIVFAAPIARGWWVLGRLTGHSLLALGSAAAATLPLLLVASPDAVLPWGMSLAFECVLVAGLAVLVTISLVRLPLSLLAVLAIYACARSIGVIQMLGDASEGGGWTTGLIDLLALLMPRLDLNARTAWLLSEGIGLPDLLPGLAQTLLYGLLIAIAASLDIERRRA